MLTIDTIYTAMLARDIRYSTMLTMLARAIRTCTAAAMIDRRAAALAS